MSRRLGHIDSFFGQTKELAWLNDATTLWCVTARPCGVRSLRMPPAQRVMASGRLCLHRPGEPVLQQPGRGDRPEHLRHRQRQRDQRSVGAPRSRRARWAAGAGRRVACEPPFFLVLEQRGANYLIAVKHSRRVGFQVIRDRLTYSRRAPWQSSRRERKRGRDLTWTLRGMPAPEWVAEN